jgi:hypothetical protein
MVTSGSFMLIPQPARPLVSRVGTTGLRGRLALGTTGLTGYPPSLNDPEVIMPPRPHGPITVAAPLGVADSAAAAFAAAVATADADSAAACRP